MARPKRAIFEARLAEAEKLVLAGLTANQVAIETGMDRRSVITHFPGIHTDRRKRLTDGDKRAIQWMILDGVPLAEIARTFNYNPATLYKHFPHSSADSKTAGQVGKLFTRLEHLT